MLLVRFCLQLEETQTKRHDQLVEQYNQLLQEIQDLKPKVLLIDPLFVAVVELCVRETNPGLSLRADSRSVRSCDLLAAATDFSPTRSQISTDVNSGRLQHALQGR